LVPGFIAFLKGTKVKNSKYYEKTKDILIIPTGKPLLPLNKPLTRVFILAVKRIGRVYGQGGFIIPVFTNLH
jgi:hypothetical protein